MQQRDVAREPSRVPLWIDLQLIDRPLPALPRLAEITPAQHDLELGDGQRRRRGVPPFASSATTQWVAASRLPARAIARSRVRSEGGCGGWRPGPGGADGGSQPSLHWRHTRDRRGEQPPGGHARRLDPARESSSIDALRVDWRRALDMNDRTLRRVVVGLGGRPNGFPRETGFDITAASEVMAVMAIARDLKELRRRLGAITVAHRYDGGGPVTAEDLGAAGAMIVLLKDALKPNLIQTLEGQPCLMHCGPFANIDHGNNSLVADLIAMKLGDYVVTECGFGSDLGMEKFVDIVCRLGGLMPSAAVLVTTVRAIKRHGGVAHDRPPDHGDGPRAIE